MILPGNFVYPDQPLAKVSPFVDSECLKSIAAHFVLETIRTFDQDPRFGFVLLSEIASRALSPGINDPGTALDAINSATRLLKIRSDLKRKATANPKAVIHSRIFIPLLRGDQLIGAMFAPVARDGAGIFEVGVRIQKALKVLKAYDTEYEIGCDLYSNFAKEHDNMTLKTQFEKNLIANAAAQN